MLQIFCAKLKPGVNTLKAKIEIALRGSVFSVAAAQLKAAESSPAYTADYHLSFESARTLFQS